MILAAAALAGSVAIAADEPSPTWEGAVRPILKARCMHCHGEEEPVEGGVDLRLRRFLEREVEGHGPLLVPGDTTRGELLRVIRDGEMPKSGKPVTPEELAVIERWIAAGAVAGETPMTAERKAAHESTSTSAWRTMTAAIAPEYRLNASATGSSALKGSVNVWAATLSGTPGEFGIPSVNKPDPALTNRASACP